MLDTRLFPPDYRGKYPHMFKLDVAVWERFLDRYSELYEGFYYDVVVGKEIKGVDHLDIPYQKDAWVLSQLRIDAIGERTESTDIIEVKPRGNMAAIGQLLTYKELYIKEYSPKKHVRMILVAGEIDPNIISLTEKHKIVYISI